MARASAIKAAQDAGNTTNCESVILYGAPKSGKSILAAGLAEHFNLLWLDIENGSSVIFNEKFVKPEWLDNIELIKIPDWKKNPVGIEYTMKLFSGQVLDICDAHGKANCATCNRDEEATSTKVDLMSLDPSKWIVVLDSLTQVTRSAQAYITNKQLGGKDSKFEFDHWRLQNTYIDIVLDCIQAGLFNCVAITHEQGIDQSDGTEKITPSASTKNYARTIAKNFGHAVHVKQAGSRHVVFSNSTDDPKAVTGSRLEVDVAKDGLAAIFKPSLRSAPSKTEDTSKKPTVTKPASTTKPAGLSKFKSLRK